MKKCCVCNLEKSTDEFYNYKNSKDGKMYRCKSCDSLARKKWSINNPERSLRSVRSRQLKYKYGITLEEFEKLLERQGGKCACCGVTKNNTTGSSRNGWNFAVDHCHETNKIRGLLCNQCNRGIGMLGDTPEALLRAYNYLKDTH